MFSDYYFEYIFCSYGHGPNNDLHQTIPDLWDFWMYYLYQEKGNLHVWLRLSGSDHPRFSMWVLINYESFKNSSWLRSELEKDGTMKGD